MDHEVTKHSIFYYDEPDTIVFQVQAVLFRPHTFILRRYSELFSDMLALQSETASHSVNNPIVLEDIPLSDAVHKEITADSFALGLRALYPEELLDNPIVAVDDLMAVLEVSRRWRSPYLRHLALRGLSLVLEQMTAAQRLQVAIEHDHAAWMPRVYGDLCLRCDPITEDEAARIPAKHLIGLFTARERVRSMFNSAEAKSSEPPSGYPIARGPPSLFNAHHPFVPQPEIVRMVLNRGPWPVWLAQVMTEGEDIVSRVDKLVYIQDPERVQDRTTNHGRDMQRQDYGALADDIVRRECFAASGS